MSSYLIKAALTVAAYIMLATILLMIFAVISSFVINMKHVMLSP